MLSRLLIMNGVEHAVQLIGVDLCLFELMPKVYGAARESHNERTWNTLKNSTCSHKWWETLKCLIFGVKPSINAFRGRVVFWW